MFHLNKFKMTMKRTSVALSSGKYTDNENDNMIMERGKPAN